MKKFKGSILLDFLLVTVIVFSGLIMLLNIVNSISKKKMILQQNSTNVKTISQSLTNLAKNAIMFYNIDNFNKNVSPLINENRYINEISIYAITSNDHYKIIYSSKKENQGNIVKSNGIKTTLSEEKSKYIEGIREENGKKVYKCLRIIKNNGEVVGILNIIVSLEDIEAEDSKSFLLNTLITIFSIIFMIVFTSALLYFRIYYPILYLTKDVKRIINGEIGHKLKIKVNNEISELANAIEKMKNSIWENSLDHRMANPITGLQGTMALSEDITNRIHNDEVFGLISVGLKNVKPFLLTQGIVQNEELQRFVLDLISSAIEKNKVENYKMYQLTEHQFVVILESKNIEKIGKEIGDSMNNEIKKLYNDNVEGVEIQSESGGNVSYPLINAVIVGITTLVRGEVKSYKDVEDRIIECEKRYFSENEKTIFIMAGAEKSEENEAEEENSVEDSVGAEEAKENSDESLLQGLEEIGEDTSDIEDEL